MTDPSGYTWLSNNWRSLVGVAIGIAASVVTHGLLAPGLATLTVWGATAAGAVGGFAGGFSGTLLNGGDLGQAIKAGVVGGIIGGASGFLAFAAGSVEGSGLNAILEKMGRHAFANAWLSGMQGQNMFSGMLTGASSSLGGAGLQSLNIENVGMLTAGNAVIGGTVSVIGGGKFANGAVTGAFTMLFNHLAHPDNKGTGPKYFTEDGKPLWKIDDPNMPDRAIIIPNDKVKNVLHAIEDYKNGNIDVVELQSISERFGKEWSIRTDLNGDRYIVRPKDLGYYIGGFIDCGTSSWNHVYSKKQIPTKFPSTFYDPYTKGILIKW